MQEKIEQYITSNDDYDIARAVNDELERALSDAGFKDPDESAIREHCRIIESKDGTLSYYWDDILLLRTKPTTMAKGIKIEHE